MSSSLLEKFAVLAAEDPSPVVRLALASALQRVPPAARWPIATALVAHAEDAGDHNLPLMNWYAIEPLVTLDKLEAVWGTVRATPADRQAEFASWRAKLSPKALQAADLAHGHATYATTCGACHQLHGEGGGIGPDLTGSNRADLEYLLANLLDPSAIVGRDYQTTIVITDDGRSIAGIVVQETPTSVTLQTPAERVTVSLDDIETRVLSPQSLMPENQLAQLSPEAARDLVAYLRHPTQVPLPGR